MAGRLAKCPRCNKLFSKDMHAVCSGCLPKEEEDYRKIRKILDLGGDRTPLELAQAAGVPLDCVYRLRDEGSITQVASGSVKCGRCGKPALSTSRKLCAACLNKLESECSQTVIQMANQVKESLRGTSLNVRQTVESKRRAP